MGAGGGRRILVGTADGLHELGVREGSQLVGREIRALVRGEDRWWAIVDDREIDTYCLAASGRTVAAGTDDGLVFLSHDQGTSWALLAKGLPSVRCVVID